MVRVSRGSILSPKCEEREKTMRWVSDYAVAVASQNKLTERQRMAMLTWRPKWLSGAVL